MVGLLHACIIAGLLIETFISSHSEPYTVCQLAPCLCYPQHCSSYDAQVSEWLWSKVGSGPAPMMTVPMQLQQTLRYGENPHQPAAFYTDSSLREATAGGVATSIVHWGKEMSYNNYLVRCKQQQRGSAACMKHADL